MKRIGWIDITRGFAMLLIIMGHSFYNYFGTIPYKVIFAVHVPIFFVLSGYLFRYQPFRKLINKLFRNLLMPYFFTGGIALFFSWITFHHPLRLLHSMGNAHSTLLAILYGIGTPLSSSFIKGVQFPSIGVIWFLLAMFVGDLLFNSIYAISSQKKEIFSVYLVTLSFTICGLGFMFATFFPLPWSINAAMISQPFYWFGNYLRRNSILSNRSPLLLIVGIILWGLSVWSGVFFVNTAFATNEFLAILGALGGSYVIMRTIILLSSHWNLRVLAIYGRLSLIAMCFHMIDLSLFRIGDDLFQQLEQIGKPVLGVVLVIVYHTFFTLIATWLIPKVPLLRSIYLNRQYPFSRHV